MTIIQYSKEELRLLQLNELEMLIELDRICRKNGINYSLDGGTLLGAIRHKGFIPWDDDVDVMMLKEEYEAFYKACISDLDTNRFFFQDYRTDPGYRWGYGKLRSKQTEYIKAGHEKAKYKTGVCIDVFGFDNIPDNKVARAIFLAKMYCLRKITYSELGRYNSDKRILRKWYSLLYCIPKAAVFSVKQRIDKKYATRITKNVINSMLPFPKKECKYGFPKKWFDNYIEVEFEGMQFLSIKNYDSFLKLKYEDYMALPPEGGRKGVMDASVLKLKKLSLRELQARYWEENRNTSKVQSDHKDTSCVE